MDAEAAARAGDPGPVSLRRFSNSTYDNAIRDLTGFDLRPTRAREFPLDSVGGEGFANVGDAMPDTPELIERYHQTARDVAARVVLLPNGIRFSASTERPDWTEESLRPLCAFHARHAGPQGEPPLAEHLVALIRHRDRLVREDSTALGAIAAAAQLNDNCLAALWDGLHWPALTCVDLARHGIKNAALPPESRPTTERVATTTSLRQTARQVVDPAWVQAKRVLATDCVAEEETVSIEQQVTVQPGESVSADGAAQREPRDRQYSDRMGHPRGLRC